MAATPLPSSGEPPLDGPLTCDASGMIDIHRLYRHSFGEAGGLVDGVKDGDSAHADVVASQLALISTSLHAHHEGEDLKLWPAIDERAPSCALHVERMKAQHAQMLVHLTALDAALPTWRTAPGAATVEPVRTALAGINAALAEHLPDEEANIVPVMEHVVTKDEEKWFADHGRKSTPKGQQWNMLGAILAAQPDGGDVWMKKNLPGPVVLLWRWVGRPRYLRYRAALEGRPGAASAR
ncbi:hemerythrin domain-containing protein [Leifsonia shinshuensis]|uniref:Hemerythrin domain-containing protein n=1 Tax=Leifsonia shinshuensis TaxID=150026 RepID=A0A7G6YAI2_9MICO|nr:hemerythrin domain-containing protein [Leifsonia shinshuensis]QNE35497.1 hemerythrin domain-containing protein [Leifsonia shinshuensis]